VSGYGNSWGQGHQVGDGREARNSATANQTGVWSLWAFGRITTLPCPIVEGYESGMRPFFPGLSRLTLPGPRVVSPLTRVR